LPKVNGNNLNKATIRRENTLAQKNINAMKNKEYNEKTLINKIMNLRKHPRTPIKQNKRKNTMTIYNFTEYGHKGAPSPTTESAANNIITAVKTRNGNFIIKLARLIPLDSGRKLEILSRLSKYEQPKTSLLMKAMQNYVGLKPPGEDRILGDINETSYKNINKNENVKYIVSLLRNFKDQPYGTYATKAEPTEKSWQNAARERAIEKNKEQRQKLEIKIKTLEKALMSKKLKGNKLLLAKYNLSNAKNTLAKLKKLNTMPIVGKLTLGPDTKTSRSGWEILNVPNEQLNIIRKFRKTGKTRG